MKATTTNICKCGKTIDLDACAKRGKKTLWRAKRLHLCLDCIDSYYPLEGGEHREEASQ